MSQRDELARKFQEFKTEIVVLCKSEIKYNEEQIINFVNRRTNEALYQIKEDVLSGEMVTSNVDERPRPRVQEQRPSNHQKCQEDEDVIFDPYVVTMWINKLRNLYCLKIGNSYIKLLFSASIK